MLTATLRRDGSSKFAPKNRWGWFPSFALAYRVSDEDFMKDYTTISNLKLRAGWGAVGNQNIPDEHAWFAVYISKGSTWGSGLFASNTPNEESGTYFLRTSLSMSEELIWMIYNIIREIEYSFRTLKTDLDLRPIYHRKDPSTMAHLHLGLLAYWVVNTIRYQLKKTETENESDKKQETDETETDRNPINF
jgi:transposase